MGSVDLAGKRELKDNRDKKSEKELAKGRGHREVRSQAAVVMLIRDGCESGE